MTKDNNRILGMIDAMTADEMRTRLSEYMANDTSLMPRLVAIEVRLAKAGGARCRYSVFLIDEQGNEFLVKFRDRYSRLIYIYTLLNPHGYQRRTVAANDYRALRQLYNLLYLANSDALLKTINSTGYDHFFSHYVTQSRRAVSQASPLAGSFAIDRPQAHNGNMLIPFVEQGGTVIIDNSLLNKQV